MLKPSRPVLAAALLAALVILPLQSRAGLFDDDEARKAILDVRNNKADKASVLELSGQIDALRQEIARLRGQVEVLTNDVSSLQQRQKDFYVDHDNRLRKLEPQKVVVDGKEAVIEPAEQQAYDAALEKFKAGEYKPASAAFSGFLQRYPKSAYAAAAQYWLGSAFYAQRDYRHAISAQSQVVKHHAESPQAPEAMLNIASCYLELKDRMTAKKTLERLVARYPQSEAAKTAKERLAALK
ncbi:MAG: ybgF [Burkholderiaceae bacterium]|nr:ybgF [Burkholderiaceae bacterium]